MKLTHLVHLSIFNSVFNQSALKHFGKFTNLRYLLVATLCTRSSGEQTFRTL